MQILDSYIGIRPWTVLVDDSPELRQLAARAHELRGRPFPEQLAGVKQLVLEGNVNAYERMRKTTGQEQQRFGGVVNTQHPLSVALRERALCCRYQGALFFVLGYEAAMGDTHFLEAAPVAQGMNTVFNRVWEGIDEHLVNMFTESLEDRTLDYTHTNPNLFKQAFTQMSGFTFYSYHKTPQGVELVANPDRQVRQEELLALLR